jgi:hypothetical protein
MQGNLPIIMPRILIYRMISNLYNEENNWSSFENMQDVWGDCQPKFSIHC